MTFSAPNIFLGSLDSVLSAMADRLAVDMVIAPRGRLRNMRLQRQLEDAGTQWIEVATEEEYVAALSDITAIGYMAVAGFSWRIRQASIASSRLIVNFHPGDIRRCRGPQPLESSLVHRFSEIGVSAHVIDSEAIDCGPLLHQEKAAVSLDKGYSWHKRRMDDLLAGAAATVFSNIAQGRNTDPAAWEVEKSLWYPKEPANVLKALYCAPTLDAFYAQL